MLVPAEKFITAVKLGNFGLIRWCVANGVDINCSLDDKNTALHIAAERGDFALLSLLSKYRRIEPNKTNIFGDTPLLLACQYGKIRCIKLLIKLGADVNARDHMEQTPLCKVIINNDLILTLLLLKNDADVNIVDAFQRSPLGIAAHQITPNMYMVRMLLRYGAQVNQPFKDGPSILLKCCLCCHNGSHLKVIEYLIEQGADMKTVEPISHRGILHMVALTGCHKLAQLLISYDEADPHLRDTAGNLAINVATLHGHNEVALLLEDCMHNISNLYSILSKDISEQ